MSLSVEKSIGTETHIGSVVSCTVSSQFENYFPEMCSGFEAGSYLRLIDVSLNSRLESNKEEAEESRTVGALYPTRAGLSIQVPSRVQGLRQLYRLEDSGVFRVLSCGLRVWGCTGVPRSQETTTP